MIAADLPYSIRVACFWGDVDDYQKLYLIGPYRTAEARDAALQHLASLPGNYGCPASGSPGCGVGMRRADERPSLRFRCAARPAARRRPADRGRLPSLAGR
ncbi:hypothetical protein GCM10010170_034760 [Dactylosporangium salmoneum]|uniref:SPOR domain-containing protein n=1 Tax=Dactylosporangium salmoneum TaxID=53361 RepID=A0ABN3GA07_9ACTN